MTQTATSPLNIEEYVDMAGAGHLVAGNQNDTFSKGILEFLVRL